MPDNRTKKNSTNFLNANITTTISITLVLMLLGLSLLMAYMGNDLIVRYIKENTCPISIKIPDGYSDSQINDLRKQIVDYPFVKSAIFVSKDEIKRDLIEALGGDPQEITGYDQTYSLFDVQLVEEYVRPDSIEQVKKYLNGLEIVDDEGMDYDANVLDVVNKNLSKFEFTLLALALLLMLISFTLIRNTIRLNIYSKRFLINTMQLVGATNAFIRKPFVINFALCGLIAALIANVFITFVIYSATREFAGLVDYLNFGSLAILYVLVFTIGACLTVAATVFSVNYYLKMETNRLYQV